MYTHICIYTLKHNNFNPHKNLLGSSACISRSPLRGGEVNPKP